MYIYFIRHGESEANVLHEFSNGLNKHPLTARGYRQAQALAARMKEVPLTAIYTSPILRARQTAAILAESQRLIVATENALREFDIGLLEGHSDQESWKTFDKVNQEWLQGINQDVPLAGGESYMDVKRRFLPFLQQIIAAHADPPGQHLALVGHGGTYRLMLPLVIHGLSGQTMTGKGMGNTSIIMAETQSGYLRLISWDGEMLTPNDGD
ncbi:MAG: histidine phosphatase family protein [Anaerolineae bacterium]|nr:histidine phosphatase family protein [Anaerolineae bacterium]